MVVRFIVTELWPNYGVLSNVSSLSGSVIGTNLYGQFLKTLTNVVVDEIGNWLLNNSDTSGVYIVTFNKHNTRIHKDQIIVNYS